jgi:hypothetical protein
MRMVPFTRIGPQPVVAPRWEEKCNAVLPGTVVVEEERLAVVLPGTVLLIWLPHVSLLAEALLASEVMT